MVRVWYFRLVAVLNQTIFSANDWLKLGRICMCPSRQMAKILLSSVKTAFSVVTCSFSCLTRFKRPSDGVCQSQKAPGSFQTNRT